MRCHLALSDAAAGQPALSASATVRTPAACVPRCTARMAPVALPAPGAQRAHSCRLRCRVARCPAAALRAHASAGAVHDAAKSTAVKRTAVAEAVQCVASTSDGAPHRARRRGGIVAAANAADERPEAAELLLRAAACGSLLTLVLLWPTWPADAEATAAVAAASPLSDALRTVAAKTFRGGVAGFAAGAMQVRRLAHARTRGRG
jgi:hypothetical protein